MCNERKQDAIAMTDNGLRGEEEISFDKERLEKTPAMAVTTIDPVLEDIILPPEEEGPLDHDEQVGIGFFRFRFSLSSFRLGRGFSLRRFSIAEAALLLIMAYIASRGLGVVRQSIFNAIFGTGPEANAYYAAFRLPDTLFNLIAGGALIQAFVPVFVSYEKRHGQAETWRLTSLVFNVLLVTLTALLLAAEFFTPAFVSKMLVPGYSPSVQALTTSLTRIVLVQPLILGIGTIITAVLSSKRQFLLPALSIAVYNIGLIGGLLFTLAIPGVGIYGPTYGVLAAAVCQLLVQVPGLLKQKARYMFVWDLKHPGLHEVLHLLGPGTLSVAVLSVGFIMDTAFTSFLADQASLAALHNAQMLFALPVALLAQAVAQAALPRMSSLATDGHYLRLRHLMRKVVGAAVLLSVPTAIGLVVLGQPLIHLLFQHGAFTYHSSYLTFLALVGYAIGLPGQVAGDLLARSFYSFKDARTPLFTNIFALLVRFGLIILLLKLLAGTSVLIAIPLAASGALTAEALLLCLLLFLRLRAKIKHEKAMQTQEQKARCC
jgi:putative peptidoglycan lipid II flippase